MKKLASLLRPPRWTAKAGCVLLTVLAFAFAQMESAALTSLFVATNGNGNGSSWAEATNSIQGAISAIETTNPTNTVWVSNGVYEVGGVTNWPSGSLLTNRVAITNAITVRSANNDPTNTIIRGVWDSASTTNGPAAVRCVYMASGSSLIGFMLTNGATLATGTADKYGGGIHSPSITTTTISNCVILGNSAASGGGGVYYGTLYNCTLIGNSVAGNEANIGGGGGKGSIMYNCTLSDNKSLGVGGGMDECTLHNCMLSGNKSWSAGGGAHYGYLYNCRVISNSVLGSGGGGGMYSARKATNCMIVGNSTAGDGGGVYYGTLYNCMLAGNSAAYDGGGAWNAILYNCTLTGNSASYRGGGVYEGTLYNCIVYFNDAPFGFNWNWYDSSTVFTNSCTVPNPVGQGERNITDNPMFIANGSGYGANHVAGNYRLRTNSPCVNTGTNQSWMTNSYDLDGRPRIWYGTVDMGAYELILIP